MTLSADAGSVKSHMTSVSIQQFRGISDLDLTFLDPLGDPSKLVVLGGPNGSGKTSVLYACLAVLQYENYGSKSSLQQYMRKGGTDFRIGVSLRTDAGDITIELTPDARRTLLDGVPVTQNRQDPAAAVPIAFYSSWRAPKLKGPLGITAGKRGRPHAETEENRFILIKQHLINAKAHQQMAERPAGDSAYDTKIARLNSFWNLFHQDSPQRFSVEPVGNDPDDGFDVFVTGHDGAPIDVASLSSGELELFGFVGNIIMTKVQPTIVLIDEVELHLNPQWHLLILRALRELLPETQFIVTTHSPDIYESALSYERHFLISEDDPRNAGWTRRPSEVQN